MHGPIGTKLALAIAIAMAFAGCGRQERQVKFASDVKPVLDRACVECHEDGKAGYEASGLSVATYDALMNGTRFGPVVLPGDPESSVLVQLIEGRADPSIKMPHGSESLYEGEIETIRLWVSQGAPNN